MEINWRRYTRKSCGANPAVVVVVVVVEIWDQAERRKSREGRACKCEHAGLWRPRHVTTRILSSHVSGILTTRCAEVGFEDRWSEDEEEYKGCTHVEIMRSQKTDDERTNERSTGGSRALSVAHDNVVVVVVVVCRGGRGVFVCFSFWDGVFLLLLVVGGKKEGGRSDSEWLRLRLRLRLRHSDSEWPILQEEIRRSCERWRRSCRVVWVPTAVPWRTGRGGGCGRVA